ncbi:asparagine synthase (glutamine-hydrolyzing) [Mongoliitalea daihaiensis]|uniref:asparagine synthase (glutamine-hydrolyzing) n=1 Tax=Mongoliitalea daihaiensis TaxID=2782006 RepID=UPI001F24E298|nr:asparagine synthase (glutamine-hydrolyzing) [Mongoliitalea daihaiensis]UJP65986.1 asparagine synthase (glutamine-hydrolyzing) [Mongoliitalea daihaiensis]
MCGINLLIRKDDLTSGIQQMMQATAHRGPDHSDFYVHKEHIAFAGNRLKILDMSDASNQPFWSDDRQQVLIWNGALYNYQDLRNHLLDAGFVFKTNSDTEVLLYWLIHKGVDGLQDCRGMFALAFIDFSIERVIILRDFSGEKPLYYWNQGNEWIFSSEQRGILAAMTKKPMIDATQVEAFLTLRHTLPNHGFFDGIAQVLPGCGLVITFEGNIHKWIELPKQSYTEERNQSTFEDLLKDSILHNFHTERAVGMVLSGGIDSSLLYALWYEETMQPMPTFTATFEQRYQRKYRDPVYVEKLQSSYPSLHHPILITLSKVQEAWNDYITQLDMPIGDSASLLTWMIAKEASKDVQVLISGAGADELFGGYTRHAAFIRYLKRPKLYLAMKRFLPVFGNFRLVNKFFTALDPSAVKTFIHMAAVEKPSDNLMKKLISSYPEGPDVYKSALDWDRQVYLVNDILKIHDNACMAHGIEGRAPYLSQELISLSQSMTEQEHLQQVGKVWLKEALNKRGLRVIANRKKLGFGLPLQEWMQNKEFQHWVFSEIRTLGALWEPFFPEQFRRFVVQPEQIPNHQFLTVWNLFTLLSWLHKHA